MVEISRLSVLVFYVYRSFHKMDCKSSSSELYSRISVQFSSSVDSVYAPEKIKVFLIFTPN